MALTSEKIFDAVSSKFPCKLLGPEREEIYNAWYYRSSVPCKPGLIYIASEAMPITRRHTDCILLVPKGINLHAVLVAVRQLITLDYRQSLALMRLRQAVCGAAPPNEVIHLCHAATDNTVLRLGLQFQPVDMAVSHQDTLLPAVFDFEDLRRYSLTFEKGARLMEPNHLTKHRRILGKIVSQGRISGYLLVIDDERTLEPLLDVDCVAQICDILSNYHPGLSPHDKLHMEWERFLSDLIERRLTDPVLIQQKMRRLHWEIKGKYYVLVVVNERKQCTASERNRLQSLLQQDVYRYTHYYVCILNCPWNASPNVLENAELQAFLKNNRLLAGLSNGFSDVSFFHTAFQQGVESLHIGHEPPPGKVARFEEKMIPYLLKTASDSGVELLALCDPVVLRILEYDQQHKSSYLPTLAAYILADQTLQQAADLLFIHRNTMYNRITKIEELFSLTLQGFRETQRIYISVLILDYLGLADLSGLL